ncbi:MAG: alpha/beta hydrolase [Bdellovibrionota bacterium]
MVYKNKLKKERILIAGFTALITLSACKHNQRQTQTASTTTEEKVKNYKAIDLDTRADLQQLRVPPLDFDQIKRPAKSSWSITWMPYNLTDNSIVEPEAVKNILIDYSDKIQSIVLKDSPSGTEYLHDGTALIRVGFRPHSNKEEEAKGNIIYLEGLADSFLNHEEMFSMLNNEGYNIIAFDYMGQGGSRAAVTVRNNKTTLVQISMNNTRVSDEFIVEGETYKGRKEISVLANQVYDHISNLKQLKFDKNLPKIALGWSTGGLAAYKMAYNGEVERAILIAPGICVKVLEAGTGIFNGNKITVQTLTSAAQVSKQVAESYGIGAFLIGSANDPHVDPIHPNSPIDAPFFSVNLIGTSYLANGALENIADSAGIPLPKFEAKKYINTKFEEIVKTWKIKIPILVLLSDPKDSYVDATCTKNVVQKNAPNSTVKEISEALHEIDNERTYLRKQAFDAMKKFL